MIASEDVAEELALIVGNAERIPTLPSVAVEVLRLTSDESSSMEDLSAAISSDPALCARLLRMANSSMFRRGAEVTSLAEATTRLGFKTVKLMALSFSVAANLPRKGNRSFDYAGYWRRSLVMAVAARSLARLVKCRHEDEAFLCGLLSSLGRLVMAECMMDRYGEVLAGAPDAWPSAERERGMLGFDNHLVGELVLRSWELPRILSAPIRHADDPSASPEDLEPEIATLARVLHVSRAASSLICEQAGGRGLEALEATGTRYLGLAAPEMEAFFVGLEGGITETAILLNVQMPDVSSYEKIVDKARNQLMALSIDAVADLQHAADRARELERENRELTDRANRDALTGLANRARFDIQLREVTNARLGGAPGAESSALGLLMIDVDHFKRFNDAHGHPAGDEALRRVAKAIASSVRGTTLAARYGGEEFVVLLPNVSLENLEAIAERMRLKIESMPIEIGAERHQVTVSVGGALVDEVRKASDGRALLTLADQCLYQAKNAGRNCTVCREVKRV